VPGRIARRNDRRRQTPALGSFAVTWIDLSTRLSPDLRIVTLRPPDPGSTGR